MTATPDAALTDMATLVRLLHLVSPCLPTGGFAYSQGLEWAVEAAWIKDGNHLELWLKEVLQKSLACVDVPLFSRLYKAVCDQTLGLFTDWSLVVLACRETRELRQEEKDRGRAFSTLLKSFEIKGFDSSGIGDWYDVVSTCQLAGFALAAAGWQIPVREAAAGYLWAWLENQVLAGVKIIPLGQTEGQKILHRLSTLIRDTVDTGMAVHDDDIGSSLPALAIGSSCHEIQYTRLFRS
jgi:urease accessory protein